MSRIGSVARSRGVHVAAVAAGLTVALGGTASAAKPPSITIRPVVAPNVFGSPSFAQFRANAIQAFHTGARTVGSGPSQYKEVKRISFSQLVCSGFPSWNGAADPANAFGLAYASELGNRLHLAWRLKARRGQTVNIANGVRYDFLAGNDPVADDLGGVTTTPGLSFFFNRTSYSTSNVGIKYGPDGKAGGGDDIILDSGTGAVNEIIGLSPGNCEAADPAVGLEAQQASLDATLALVRATGAYDITAKVKYLTLTKTATVQVR